MAALAVVAPVEAGATLAVVPRHPATLPLYLVEEELESYVATAELVEPAQEAQFLEEFRQALATARDARDRIGRFFGFCESQDRFAGEEIKRLQARRKSYQATIERMEKYIVRIIEEKGTDVKGKYPKLEGTTFAFGLRACPASVDITNEEVVPSWYKTLTITIPALSWEMLMDSVDPELRDQVLRSMGPSQVSLDKVAIKRDIEAGRDVDGADLAINKHSLVRT